MSILQATLARRAQTNEHKIASPSPERASTNPLWYQIATRVDDAGEESDALEREAEQVAATVDSPVTHSSPRNGESQGSARPSAPSPRVDRSFPASVNGLLESEGGEPLAASMRTEFEQRFAHDFGAVRIHAGERAAKSAESLNAQAYTAGPNIVFGAGMYRPADSRGRRLLAHELSHVVQQGAAPEHLHQNRRGSTAPQLRSNRAIVQRFRGVVPVRVLPVRPPGMVGAAPVPGVISLGAQPVYLDSRMALVMQVERSRMNTRMRAAISEYELPVATLQRGGSARDGFISVTGVTQLAMEGMWPTARRRVFHLLDALEADLARASDHDDFLFVAQAYFPGRRILSPADTQRLLVRYPSSWPMLYLPRDVSIPPSFDSDGSHRLAVIQAALARRNGQPTPLPGNQPGAQASPGPGSATLPTTPTPTTPTPTTPAPTTPTTPTTPTPTTPAPTTPAPPTPATPVIPWPPLSQPSSTTGVNGGPPLRPSHSVRPRTLSPSSRPRVTLWLPRHKQIHIDIYRGFVRSGLLANDHPYTRGGPDQTDKWDRSMDIHRGGDMVGDAYGLGLRLGLPDARIFRPDWSPIRPGARMQVDHIVELQCLTLARHAENQLGNMESNYELLDGSSNASSGVVIERNIERERWDMYYHTGDPRYLTANPLRFEDVQPEPGAPIGERWLFDEVSLGDHLRTYARWRRRGRI
ncbi:DUF4157 domain-containing protein [Nannocystaceae bacterium ST9]